MLHRLQLLLRLGRARITKTIKPTASKVFFTLIAPMQDHCLTSFSTGNVTGI